MPWPHPRASSFCGEPLRFHCVCEPGSVQAPDAAEQELSCSASVVAVNSLVGELGASQHVLTKRTRSLTMRGTQRQLMQLVKNVDPARRPLLSVRDENVNPEMPPCDDSCHSEVGGFGVACVSPSLQGSHPSSVWGGRTAYTRLTATSVLGEHIGQDFP